MKQIKTIDKKTILFDFDGVLVDSLPVVANIHNEILRHFGKEIVVTPALIRTHWKDNWQNLYKDAYGFLESEIPTTVPLFQKFAAEQFPSVCVYQGMAEAVKHLSKVFHLVMLSGNYSVIVVQTLMKEKLDKYFLRIFGNDDFGGVDKANPRFFYRALDVLNLEKDNAILLTDTAGEIYAAKKADIPVVACSWGWQDRDDLIAAAPDYLADDPDELFNILEGMR